MANGGKTWIPKKEKESDIYTSFLDGIREHTEKKEKYLPENSRYSTDDRTEAASENKDWKTKYTEKNYPFKLRDSKCLPSPFSSSYNSDWIREHTEKKEKYLPGNYRYSTYDRPEAAAIDKPLRTKFPEQNLPCEHEQPKSTTRSDSSTDVTHIKEEIRIVLLGRTGAGKSATGNTILNKRQFKSQPSGSSVTKKCQKGMVVRDGKTVLVVDTPGMFDTDMTEQKVRDEIKKCIYLTSPGPHAFILIVSIGRFTKEEQDTVDLFVRYFGEGILKYMIVLFTRRDDIEKQNKNISQYVQECPDYLKTILGKCNHRFIAFNNNFKGDTRDEQVKDLLNTIERILATNKGSFYTNEMYYFVERAIQQEIIKRHQKYQLEQKTKTDELVRHISKSFEDKLKTSDLTIIHLEKDLEKQQKKSERLILAKDELASEIKSLENKKRNLSRRSYYGGRSYNTSYFEISDSFDSIITQEEIKDEKRELEEQKHVLREINKQLTKSKTERENLKQQIDEQNEYEIGFQYEEESKYNQLRNDVRNDIENGNETLLSSLDGAVTGAITGAVMGGVAFGPIGAAVGGFFGFIGGLFS